MNQQFLTATVQGLTPCQTNLRVTTDHDGEERVVTTDNPNDTTRALATTRVQICAVTATLASVLPHPTGDIPFTVPRGA